MGDTTVIDWLLAGDPAIRWQVMRDLLDAPEAAWRTERARVETEGWGGRLLDLEDPDGQWAGGSFVPAGFDWAEWERDGQPWTATTYALTQLREFGLDPASGRARRAVALVGEHACWDHDGQPFWAGEVEECINGRTVADGAYFGVDMSPVVERLVGERLGDGGWNCERANGSLRSSFDTTINVLEGLLEHERATGGTPASIAARHGGEGFLLARGLFRRLRTGEPADERFLRFAYPNRWHFDVLRALDYFRAAAVHDGDAGATHAPAGAHDGAVGVHDGDAPSVPDPRMGDAVAHVRSRRTANGRWLLDRSLPGRTWFRLDEGVGRPSRWITLRALRVLRWWDGLEAAA